MWTTCGSQWPDEVISRPWFPTLQAHGLKSTSDYGCNDGDVATVFVIRYPWVYNGPYSDVDYYDYWGDDGNWQNNLVLPYESDTYGINCYYDNEPFDIAKKVDGSYDPHSESTMPPPSLRVWKFVKQNTGDNYIRGWQLGKKDPSDRYFVDTTGGDGFVLNVNTGDIPY